MNYVVVSINGSKHGILGTNITFLIIPKLHNQIFMKIWMENLEEMSNIQKVATSIFQKLFMQFILSIGLFWYKLCDNINNYIRPVFVTIYSNLQIFRKWNIYIITFKLYTFMKVNITQYRQYSMNYFVVKYFLGQDDSVLIAIFWTL